MNPLTMNPSSINYECRKLEELTDTQRAAWRRLQASQTHLDQPFLSWEFAKAADEFRGSVEVIVATRGPAHGARDAAAKDPAAKDSANGGSDSEDTSVVALFPFHRVSRHQAVPIADGMNEYQAFLTEEGAELDQKQWMAAARLSEYSFDHIDLSQASLRAASHTTGPCPFADLSGGFDDYCATLRERGSRTNRETSRKQRKLAREIGDVRFELETDSVQAFDALVHWKQAQHKRTDVYDTFSHESVVEFLRQVWQTRTPHFRGFLCSLYAEDKLVAVHLGIRTQRVAHMWFPTYDPELQRYSPGLVMLQEMTRSLAEEGIQRLDFGPGPQRYKRSLATGSYDVGIGEFTANACSRWLKQTWRVARRTLKEQVVPDWLKAPAQWLHAFRQRRTFN